MPGLQAAVLNLDDTLGAELARRLAGRVRTIGYSLSLGVRRKVLVVDFGGGTLDLALVEMAADPARDAGCRVIAKAGRPPV